MTLTNLPNTMPDIVTGISLMLLFIFTKVERGYFTMLLAHITFDTTYVILSVMPKLKQMNKHTYEAALDLGATPTYALYLSEVAKEKGIIDDLKLRVGLFGGEGCTAGMREQIERNFGILATDNYGMSELIGPGVSGECQYRCGLHLAEDHFIPEIIDPKTGEVLPEGEEGELVITSLTKEALPIVRYRTGDISRLNYEPCRCGRTHVRMAKVAGRSDDMLVIKGVNVFPSQIEGVLLEIDHIGPHYQLEVRRENFSDTLTVVVELIDGGLLERYQELEALRGEIRHKLRTVLGIDAKINLVSHKTIERFQGKAKRVIDLRDKT